MEKDVQSDGVPKSIVIGWDCRLAQARRSVKRPPSIGLRYVFGPIKTKPKQRIGSEEVRNLHDNKYSVFYRPPNKRSPSIFSKSGI